MKRALRSLSLGLAVAATTVATAVMAAEGPGFVDFGKLSPSASGGEFVEVNIQSNLISMVARLARAHEPEVADLIGGLKAIRVNVIGLRDDNRAEVEQQVKSIREQLAAKGWERIVTVQQDKQDVGVYMKTRGDEAVEGLVVTVLDGGSEAVLVNIVGSIKPEQITTLGERFNIEPLKKIGPPVGKS